MVLLFLNHIKELYPGLPWWSSGMNLLASAGDKGLNLGPHALEQLSAWATITEPVLQSLWAATTELTYLNYWSLRALGPSGPNYWEGMLQILSLHHSEHVLLNKRSHGPMHSMKSTPHSPQLEKTGAQQ